MCFKDRCNIPVSIGDEVEHKGKKYLIKVIEEYDMATEIIAENLKTHKVETLLLRDIKKI
jgi:hypothetical protein